MVKLAHFDLVGMTRVTAAQNLGLHVLQEWAHHDARDRFLEDRQHSEAAAARALACGCDPSLKAAEYNGGSVRARSNNPWVKLLVLVLKERGVRFKIFSVSPTAETTAINMGTHAGLFRIVGQAMSPAVAINGGTIIQHAGVAMRIAVLPK